MGRQGDYGQYGQQQDPGRVPPSAPPQWGQGAPQGDYRPPARQPAPWDASAPQGGYGQQDWQQQGYQPPPQYGQQPPPYQQYQPPYAPPPRRRKSRKGIAAISCGGLLALVVLIVVIAVAANSGRTVQTAGSPASGTAAAKAAGGGTHKTAGIGAAITLTGNDSGEQMSVTVTKVISDATPADQFNGAPSGDRLYAVQFRLDDTGTAAYSDSPSNGAAVIDSAGQPYQSGFETVSGCDSFGGTENIAAGESGLGCIVFEVPRTAKITKVQFTLDSGFGSQTGEWNVS